MITNLGILWDISEPIVSEKDSKNMRLAELAQEFLPKYLGK